MTWSDCLSQGDKPHPLPASPLLTKPRPLSARSSLAPPTAPRPARDKPGPPRAPCTALPVLGGADYISHQPPRRDRAHFLSRRDPLPVEIHARTTSPISPRSRLSHFLSAMEELPVRAGCGAAAPAGDAGSLGFPRRRVGGASDGREAGAGLGMRHVATSDPGEGAWPVSAPRREKLGRGNRSELDLRPAPRQNRLRPVRPARPRPFAAGPAPGHAPRPRSESQRARSRLQPAVDARTLDAGSGVRGGAGGVGA